MKWETRYSSSEMMYLETTSTGVLCYLNSGRERASQYSFAQVLDGATDNEVGAVFGQAVLAEIKAIARASLGTESRP